MCYQQQTRHEEQYKGHTIKIVDDQCPTDPYEDSDGMYPMIVQSGRSDERNYGDLEGQILGSVSVCHQPYLTAGTAIPLGYDQEETAARPQPTSKDHPGHCHGGGTAGSGQPQPSSRRTWEHGRQGAGKEPISGQAQGYSQEGSKDPLGEQAVKVGASIVVFGAKVRRTHLLVKAAHFRFNRKLCFYDSLRWPVIAYVLFSLVLPSKQFHASGYIPSPITPVVSSYSHGSVHYGELDNPFIIKFSFCWTVFNEAVFWYVSPITVSASSDNRRSGSESISNIFSNWINFSNGSHWTKSNPNTFDNNYASSYVLKYIRQAFPIFYERATFKKQPASLGSNEKRHTFFTNLNRPFRNIVPSYPKNQLKKSCGSKNQAKPSGGGISPFWRFFYNGGHILFGLLLGIIGVLIMDAYNYASSKRKDKSK